MPVLPQLIAPGTYRPCEWDLKRDAEGRAYWVNLFCEHLELVTELIAEEYPEADAGRIAAFRRDHLATMRAVQREPERFEAVDVLLLTKLREEVQGRHGFVDPFQGVKRRENEAALAVLSEVLRELDALAPAEQAVALAVGLMAGNLFDLGSMPTVERYRAGANGFRHACASQPARPWFIDGVEAWRGRCEAGGGYEHVLYFVDNAGSDFCLGCIPFIRWMLRSGWRVTLAANSAPALNDVTATEVADVLSRVCDVDDVVAGSVRDGRLSVTASGATTPLLDLASLAPECTDAASDADLLILHGMGRSIESNFLARLRCDVVGTAVLKDPAVAGHVGGRLFDCVFRFQPAGSEPGGG